MLLPYCTHVILIATTAHPEASSLGMPHQLEGLLITVVSYMEAILELISVLCVAIGLFKTLQLSLVMLSRRRRQSFLLVDIRLQFGVWLAMALEFQLGADILATTIAPSFETLGKLGAIALIRTFLNYFLNQELVEEYRLMAEPKESSSSSPPP